MAAGRSAYADSDGLRIAYETRRVYAQMAAGARFGDLRQGSITAPTLVLHGTDDRVVDPRYARLLADRIPHARLEMLPGLGHLFFWEAPDVFVDAVTRFALAPPPVAAISRKEPS